MLNDYKIGGNFLKILSALYTDHKVFVKLNDGLLQPIKTTIGLKQGCCLSSLLFNLFINKLPTIFDESCDPISLESERFNSLLWAALFYESVGLEIN